MDILWAPWRLSYVAAAKQPQAGDPCFICQGLAAKDDRANLIVLRTPLSVVLLNRFPYNNGHLLIAPAAHKGTLGELTAEELLESMQTLRHMVDALDKLIHPDARACPAIFTGMSSRAGRVTPTSCPYSATRKSLRNRSIRCMIN
jgi:ATP adenylyltransferase